MRAKTFTKLTRLRCCLPAVVYSIWWASERIGSCAGSPRWQKAALGLLYGLSATLMKPVVEDLHTEAVVAVGALCLALVGAVLITSARGAEREVE